MSSRHHPDPARAGEALERIVEAVDSMAAYLQVMERTIAGNSEVFRSAHPQLQDKLTLGPPFPDAVEHTAEMLRARGLRAKVLLVRLAEFARLDPLTSRTLELGLDISREVALRHSSPGNEFAVSAASLAESTSLRIAASMSGPLDADLEGRLSALQERVCLLGGAMHSGYAGENHQVWSLTLQLCRRIGR